MIGSRITWYDVTSHAAGSRLRYVGHRSRLGDGSNTALVNLTLCATITRAVEIFALV